MTICKLKKKIYEIKCNKKGFMSIEAILGSLAILMCIYLAIGFFCLLYPKLALEKEVQYLAQKAKIQGGLTDVTSQRVDSDIEIFLNNLEKFGYDKAKVEVNAKTNPGNSNAIGVTPLNEEGDNYIKRDSKEKIEITVKVPSEQFIQGPLKYFKISKESKNSLKYHYITQTVMSERW